MMSFVTICCALALIAFIAKKFFFDKSSNTLNPFLSLFDGAERPLETDKNARNAVIKKGFKPEHVPKNLDAIVIGSGMGGLSCAGLLARSGKKVLVLEQHGRIGGCTHTYRHKGFEYDIGIHYVGNMEDGSLNRCLVDCLTDKQLKWEPIHDQYDTVVIDKLDEATKSFPVVKGREAMKNVLIKHFPDDKKAIVEYFRLLKEARGATVLFVLLKILPLPLWKIVVALKLHKLFFRSYSRMSEKSLQQVVDEITDNKELKTVLTYSWGDYGTQPSKVPFMMHAMLIGHLNRTGGYYPHGGASEIAFQMVPGIEKAGGVVLARARVGEILFENGAACGVKLAKSTAFPDFEIKAPVVISDAGIYNTYHSLVPPHIRDEHGVMKDLDWIEPGMACTQVMVGLNGTSEELGLMSKNFWILHGDDVEKPANDYMAMSREDASNTAVPLIFVSFPSTKDSSWASRYPGKSTCVIVSFANKDWFEEWKEEGVKKRGQVYENLKSTFADQIWSQVLRHFPQLKDKVEVLDCGTPLSHMHYLNSMHGEIYGTNHNLARFQFEHAMKNRPKTPIPGLYLTGQDVFTAGFMGAGLGGLLAASSVLNRILFLDLIKNVKETRKRLSRKH